MRRQGRSRGGFSSLKRFFFILVFVSSDLEMIRKRFEQSERQLNTCDEYYFTAELRTCFTKDNNVLTNKHSRFDKAGRNLILILH